MFTEETASPGLWKSEIVGLLGICLLGVSLLGPSAPSATYLNWVVGLIASNLALTMSGNRRWERPVATGAAIWLFISGFVPSVLSGRAGLINWIAVGVIFIVSAVSANLNLRDDVRHARPQTM